jgi:hypothetical protein
MVVYAYMYDILSALTSRIRAEKKGDSSIYMTLKTCGII